MAKKKVSDIELEGVKVKKQKAVKVDKPKKPKKPKKPTKTQLTKKLDVIFSQYIRRRKAVKGIAECVTCGRKDEWKKLQAGHFISRTKRSVRWDEDNVQVQCYSCNIHGQGQQYLYSLYLGAERSLELYEESLYGKDFSVEEMEGMIDYYQKLVESLDKLK